MESLTDFYKRKFDWIPDNVRNELGHFNIFKLEPFVARMPNRYPTKGGIFLR